MEYNDRKHLGTYPCAPSSYLGDPLHTLPHLEHTPLLDVQTHKHAGMLEAPASDDAPLTSHRDGFVDESRGYTKPYRSAELGVKVRLGK